MGTIVNFNYTELDLYTYTIKIISNTGDINSFINPPVLNVASTDTVIADLSRRSDFMPIASPVPLPVGVASENKRIRRHNIFLTPIVTSGIVTLSVVDVTSLPTPRKIYFRYASGVLDTYDILIKTEGGISKSVPSITTMYFIFMAAVSR